MDATERLHVLHDFYRTGEEADFRIDLSGLNRTMMLSIDVIPIPTDEAVREMQNKLLGAETNVANWRRSQNILSIP